MARSNRPNRGSRRRPLHRAPPTPTAGRPTPAGPPTGAAPAFTIVELLVTLTIVAVLLSLLAPAIRSTIGTSRGFKCTMSLRAVAMDFALYADEEMHGWRGRDEALGNKFTLASFIDSQYGAAEFWRHGDRHESPPLNGENGLDPLRCAEVKTDLILRREQTCGDGAIQTPASVSYGFNMRLHRAVIRSRRGNPMLVPLLLTSDVLTAGSAPLAWDFDGAAAYEADIRPVFSAPSINNDSGDPYAGDRYWRPAFRHGGAINAAFLDGHVESSGDPKNEPGWRWEYQGGR